MKRHLKARTLCAVVACLNAMATSGEAAPPQPYAKWEETMTIVAENWANAVSSGNELTMAEVRKQEFDRLGKEFGDGARIGDWMGVVVSDIRNVSKVYETPVMGCFVRFESEVPGLTMVVTVLDYDYTTGKTQGAREGLARIRRGDIVTVSGLIRWVDGSTFLNPNQMQVQMIRVNYLMEKVSQWGFEGAPDVTGTENSLLGPENLYIAASSVKPLDPPAGTEELRSAWQSVSPDLGRLLEVYKAMAEARDFLIASEIPCADWHQRTRDYPQIAEAVKHWAPTCMETQFAIAEGSTDPYDRYKLDKTIATYRDYEAGYPGVQAIAPDSESMEAIIVRPWGQDIQAALASVHRLGEYLARELPRAETALNDINLLIEYIDARMSQ